MALNLAKFKSDLKAALLRAQAANQVDDLGDNPADKAMENLANEIATQVDAYIKTAQVTTSVTGTCATPAGAGTIAGSGTGSLV